MCTLSFIPEKNGYLLAMNRDELKTRACAAPPALHHCAEVSFLYPQEPSGGTWIAANSEGTLLAIMNANAPDHPTEPIAKLKSRGELIPALLLERTANETERALYALSHAGVNPFRLFGIFPGHREIRQWSWDGQRLISRAQDWIRNHWFSSSRSDQRAEAQRGKTFEMSWREDLPDHAAWLRSMHASHIPDAGPFSVCVHREDAATLSYTEVRCSTSELRMTYQPGHPCEPHAAPLVFTVPISRRGSVALANPPEVGLLP